MTHACCFSVYLPATAVVATVAVCYSFIQLQLLNNNKNKSFSLLFDKMDIFASLLIPLPLRKKTIPTLTNNFADYVE